MVILPIVSVLMTWEIPPFSLSFLGKFLCFFLYPTPKVTRPWSVSACSPYQLSPLHHNTFIKQYQLKHAITLSYIPPCVNDQLYTFYKYNIVAHISAFHTSNRDEVPRCPASLLIQGHIFKEEDRKNGMPMKDTNKWRWKNPSLIAMQSVKRRRQLKTHGKGLHQRHQMLRHGSRFLQKCCRGLVWCKLASIYSEKL